MSDGGYTTGTHTISVSTTGIDTSSSYSAEFTVRDYPTASIDPGALRYIDDPGITWIGAASDPVVTITLIFHDASTADCGLTAQSPGPWACGYPSPTHSLPVGFGAARFDFEDPDLPVVYQPFEVLEPDYSAVPSLTDVTFILSKVSSRVNLTGNAESGSAEIWSWPSDGSPTIDDSQSCELGAATTSCDLTAVNRYATVDCSYEVRAMQFWHGEAASFSSFNFRVPTAPDVVIEKLADGIVRFSGDGDQPTDLVQVRDAGGSLICSSAVNDSYSWSCLSGSLDSGWHEFTAIQIDQGYGAAFAADFAVTNSLDSTFRAGGTSAGTLASGIYVEPYARIVPLAVTTDTVGTAATTPISPSWNFDVTDLNLTNAHPGDTFTLRGAGLPGGSTLHVELHSTPVVLGDASVAPDGTFTMPVTIPADVPAGEHRIIATLSGPGITTTTVEKAVTVVGAESATAVGAESGTAASGAEGSAGAEGERDHAGTAPNILSQGLNSIAEVVNNPARISSALAVGLVLLIFAVLPAQLLNATIGEQYERFARRIPALRNQPRWYARAKAFLARNPVLGGLLVTSTTALLFGFADPEFGFSLASLRLFLAVSVALFVVVYLANAIAGRIVSKTWSVDVAVSIRPLGLLFTLVGVVISRALDFSPGFLIGLVLGLTIAGKSAAAHAWKAVLIRSSIVIGLALVAWLSFSAFPAGEGEHGTFFSELMLETLVAIATEGIVALLVELLPLHLLEGERLYKKSRVLWAAVYLAVITIFVVAVVPWEGNWEALGGSLWSWITIVVGFGAVCVAIYRYFRFLAAPLEEEDEGTELVSIADNETAR